jgi:hypothetical protein
MASSLAEDFGYRNNVVPGRSSHEVGGKPRASENWRRERDSNPR